MGFGSYDESEQENQQFDTDEIDETEQSTMSSHDGEIRFEYEDASTEDLLEAYEKIRDR
jgi:hypothetical protein